MARRPRDRPDAARPPRASWAATGLALLGAGALALLWLTSRGGAAPDAAPDVPNMPHVMDARAARAGAHAGGVVRPMAAGVAGAPAPASLATPGSARRLAAPRRAPVDPLADDPPAPPGPPRTEAEHRAAWLELAARQGPAALAPVATELFASDAPHPRKAAMLMALFEAGTPGAPWIAAEVIAGQPGAGPPGSVSLPVLAAGRLAHHAPRDAECRAVLLAMVDGRVPAPHGSLRRGAATCLARVGDAAELLALAAALQDEPDASLLERVARELPTNPRAAEVAWALQDLLPAVARADDGGADSR